MNNCFLIISHWIVSLASAHPQARSHFGNLLLKWYEDPMFFNVDRPLIEFTKV
jgi:hypothetical protein